MSETQMPTFSEEETMIVAPFRRLGSEPQYEPVDANESLTEDDQSVESGGSVPKSATKKVSKRKERPEGYEEEVKKKQAEYFQQAKEHRTRYKAAQRGLTRVREDQISMHTEYLPKYVPSQRGNKPQANIEWFDYNKRKININIIQPSEKLIQLIKQAGYHVSETNCGVYEP